MGGGGGGVYRKVEGGQAVRRRGRGGGGKVSATLAGNGTQVLQTLPVHVEHDGVLEGEHGLVELLQQRPAQSPAAQQMLEERGQGRSGGDDAVRRLDAHPRDGRAVVAAGQDGHADQHGVREGAQVQHADGSLARGFGAERRQVLALDLLTPALLVHLEEHPVAPVDDGVRVLGDDNGNLPAKRHRRE